MATVKDLPASRQTRVVEAAVTTLVRVAACHVCEIRLGGGSGHQTASYANTCAAPTMHVPMQSCSGRTDSITSPLIVGTLTSPHWAIAEVLLGDCHGNIPACNILDHHVTFFLLSDFPLSHALSSPCSQAVLRAELDGAALDQIMVDVERMWLLRPRARTRCALVYNFHNSSGQALLPSFTLAPTACQTACSPGE